MKIKVEWNNFFDKELQCWQISTPSISIFKSWEDKKTSWCFSIIVIIGSIDIWINKDIFGLIKKD